MEWLILVGAVVVGFIIWARRGPSEPRPAADRKAHAYAPIIPEQRPTARLPEWSITSSGNPTMNIEGCRLTVFERDGGWKFCVADGEDDDDPHFSGVYGSQKEAQERGLKWAEASIPTMRDSPELLLPIVKRIGDEAQALTRSVPDLLGRSVNSTQLRRLSDNIQDNYEAAERLQERAEDIGANDLSQSLESLVSMYEKLFDAVQEFYIEATKKERAKR